MSAALRPFWRYYGGKWRAAPRYPAPVYGTIVEPFAGAAGYALRYPDRDVVLVDTYPVVTAIWQWLINVSVDEVMAIPEVDAIDELPAWVPQPARWLIGFQFGGADHHPRARLSTTYARARRDDPTRYANLGWSARMRARIARQVPAIRHWHVVTGDYTQAPAATATWFIDPPYSTAGRHYPRGATAVDYTALADWCRTRMGQVIVCESAGATWLPFRPLYAARTAITASKPATELVWVHQTDVQE
jgi:site-specific DNA-adenine methylase